MEILYESKRCNAPLGMWCVYSHFDKSSSVQQYVFDALESLKKTGFNILFVSTSPSINEDSLCTLRQHTSIVALRENTGYDFGSYKMGIQHLYTSQTSLSQLVLTNDSVFGPLFDLTGIVERSTKYDLYGMTDSFDRLYHLQSYFIIYSQRVLASPCFSEFWHSVQLVDMSKPNFKQEIIDHYEVGGTQFFMKKQFSVGAEFSFKSIIKHQFDLFLEQLESASRKPNFNTQQFFIGSNSTHSYWEELIKMGFPYIKRELLTKNPQNVNIYNWIDVVRRANEYSLRPIIDSLVGYFGGIDFLYTTQPSSSIAAQLTCDGFADLSISSRYGLPESLQDLPISKTYVFDTHYYLDANPDVKAAVERGECENPVLHFVMYGHKENRPFLLRPR